MDLEAELMKLIGQFVVVDQEHLEPPVVAGILTRPEGLFVVEDENGDGSALFAWHEVTTLRDGLIYLENPHGVNESIPDYPVRQVCAPDDPFDDDEYWPP